MVKGGTQHYAVFPWDVAISSTGERFSLLWTLVTFLEPHWSISGIGWTTRIALAFLTFGLSLLLQSPLCLVDNWPNHGTVCISASLSDANGLY